MEAVLAAAGDLWWIAPTAAAAGGATIVAVTRIRNTGERRLDYRAAHLDLIEARRERARRHAELRVIRTELQRRAAERSATKDARIDVAGARRQLRAAEKAVRAADAGIRAARARRSAARLAITPRGDREQYPLPRLRARHDAVLRRWLDYETDPAMVLAFPAMSDGAHPATAAYFTASQRAGWLRPEPGGRVTPEEFARYRDAVQELEEAFLAAERSARGERGESPNGWQETAQQALARSAEALGAAAEAAASVIASWNRRERG